ncbi:MAG: hypothetical protein HC809_13720 [Gammaproteobacteria bacterium]|nr:hypothetical protein [Gammaproteobacteria bacterium]
MRTSSTAALPICWGGFDGGLDTENDARAWLLLEHLRQFRHWHAGSGNPFTGKVDLDRVVLIGHSRGGEAVAVAALFNRLSAYPDDARVEFEYDFGIRGVIAIAPIDGQYDPRGMDTALTDVNYLVVHGSHDGDVQSFAGSAQYTRVGFDACASCFKAGLYIVGANHGQFNTAWGRTDAGQPWGWLLNLTPIMDGAAQRRIASVSFSAFLEVVVFHRSEYRAFFDNPARGLAWLGDVEILNQYADGDRLVLADFEEDDDVASATWSDGHISGEGLSRWREALVSLKWRDLSSAAAMLGWDRDEGGPAPEYRIEFDAPLPAAERIEFALAMDAASPLRDEDAQWTPPANIDFNIVLRDEYGNSSSLPLSSVQLLYPQVDVSTRKLALFDDLDTSEPVFQRFAFGLSDFPGLESARVTSIALRFDASPAGSIYLDELAFVPLNPEYSP